MARVLIFGAHPDDAEFAMGGTMLQLGRAHDLVLCVLTRGESGTHGTPDEREQEMREAAKMAGAQLELLGMRDCEVEDSIENRKRIARVIRAHRPQLIFAPYHANPGGPLDGTAHPDHLATGTLVRFGTRYARFKGLDIPGDAWAASHLLFYLHPFWMRPALVNDVSSEDWEALVRKHKSQMALRAGAILDLLRAYRKTTGSFAGTSSAEGFVCDDPLPLDLRFLLRSED